VGITVAFFLFAVGMGIRAQRRQPTTGREGLVGLVGEVTEALKPNGRVFVEGELWFASSDEPIESREMVQIVAVQGMKLHVRRVSS
jgi:membrane-bound serine protease (ClpP class)